MASPALNPDATYPPRSARSPAPSIPSLGPPPQDIDPWVIDSIQQNHRGLNELRADVRIIADAAERIENAIGVEPAPGQGIEGKGMLKVFSGFVRDRDMGDRRRADIKLVVGAIVSTLGFLGVLLGLLKGLGLLK
jgi:hypothetical protein